LFALFRDGIRLAATATNDSRHGAAAPGLRRDIPRDPNINFLSPRFMEIMPSADYHHVDKTEHREQLNFLSPSLFSLDSRPPSSPGNRSYGEEDPLQVATNIPNMLEKVFGSGRRGGLNRDSNEWLNFIMEASNVSEQVERIEREIVRAVCTWLFYLYSLFYAGSGAARRQLSTIQRLHYRAPT